MKIIIFVIILSLLPLLVYANNEPIVVAEKIIGGGIIMPRSIDGGAPPAPGDKILMETAEFLLLETNDKILIE